MEDFIAFSKSAVLVYFFVIFCAVSFWALRRKNRERLESLKNIPFHED